MSTKFDKRRILYVSATVLLEASERGSTALFYIQMDRKELTPQKNYPIISTRPRIPLAAKNSCMKPKVHEHIAPAGRGPLMQEEREKVFMTRIWVLVRKGMEPQKHKQLEGVIAHEKVSCLRTSVSLFGHPADQPHKELHRVHFSQSDCAPFVR